MFKDLHRGLSLSAEPFHAAGGIVENLIGAALGKYAPAFMAFHLVALPCFLARDRGTPEKKCQRVKLLLTGGSALIQCGVSQGIKGKMPAPKRSPAIRRALAPKEKDFHAVAMEYLDLALPSHAVATTFPAGGGGKVRGANLKRMGMKKGWPDIQIIIRASAFDSIRSFSRFIGFEAKREIGGRVDVDQVLMHQMIKNAGGVVYVVKTLAEIYHHLTVDEGLRLRCKPQG